MVTEASPTGQTSTGAEFDLAAALAHPEIQAAILRAAEARADETEQTWKAKLKEREVEFGKKTEGWGVKERRLLLERDARAKSEDADTLQTAMSQAAAELAQAQALKEEVAQERQALELGKRVEAAIKTYQKAVPGLPDSFWANGAEQLLQGKISGSALLDEALTQAKPKPKAEGAGMIADLRGGGGGDGAAKYKQSLKDGGKLPSPSEIDGITARFLRE